MTKTAKMMLKRQGIESILAELSEKLGIPLGFVDMEGNMLFNSDSFARAVDAEPESIGSSSRADVLVGGESVGAVFTIAGGDHLSPILNAAACTVGVSLRLEAEIDDLSSEIVRVYEELSLIYSLSSKLGSELDINAICQLVVEEISRVLAVRSIALMLLDEKSGTLSIQYCTGMDPGWSGGVSVDASAEPFAGILGNSKAVAIHGRAIGNGLPLSLESALIVPLVTDNRNIGVLIAGNKADGKEFRSQEIKLINALSGEIAAAIKKAQLYERIKRLFMSTVEALASAIDAKDPYTYGHSRRVAQISAAICREVGVAKESIQLIELAALLHDIGKIGTPEKILQKPGRLLPEELETIKEHPQKGAHILSTIDELREVMEWIRHHHESYDGKGYPDKSMAEDIPLPARIIAIADSYDAMTSDRPYRKGMDSVKVMEIMDDLAGIQFDPALIRAFRTVLRRDGAESL